MIHVLNNMIRSRYFGPSADRKCVSALVLQQVDAIYSSRTLTHKLVVPTDCTSIKVSRSDEWGQPHQLLGTKCNDNITQASGKMVLESYTRGMLLHILAPIGNASVLLTP